MSARRVRYASWCDAAEVLNGEQARLLLGLGRCRFDRLVHAKVIPSRKDHRGHPMFLRRDLLRWLDSDGMAAMTSREKPTRPGRSKEAASGYGRR